MITELDIPKSMNIALPPELIVPYLTAMMQQRVASSMYWGAMAIPEVRICSK